MFVTCGWMEYEAKQMVIIDGRLEYEHVAMY